MCNHCKEIQLQHIKATHAVGELLKLFKKNANKKKMNFSPLQNHNNLF